MKEYFWVNNPGRNHFNQVIKVNIITYRAKWNCAMPDRMQWKPNIISGLPKMYNMGVIKQKHDTNLNSTNSLNKFIQQIHWPIIFKRCSVTKVKRRLKNCPSMKDSNETWWLNAKNDFDLDPFAIKCIIGTTIKTSVGSEE